MITPSQEELQSLRYLRELILNIIREIEGGGLDPNTVDALHFRLDWLHGLIARLVHLYGIDEEIVDLIRGARDCLIESRDIFGVSSTSTSNFLLTSIASSLLPKTTFFLPKPAACNSSF